MQVNASSLDIRFGSVRCVSSKLNPLDFRDRKNLCKALHKFFKWIKQNLTIKKLWGHSENAVNLHIWVAICTYLTVAYIKHQLKSNLSVYEIMQILSISAFDKTPLKELLTDNQVNQNVKEQYNLITLEF